MAYFNNLRFFDKAGNPCNFSYDSTTDSWSGTLYFPRVSVDLLENQHIFIVEDVQTPGGSDVTFPVLGNQASPAKESWKTRWETDESRDQIFTYVISTGDDGNPYISKYEEGEFANAAVAYTIISPDIIKYISSANSTPLKVNIAFTSSDEDIYERTLIIEDLSFATPKTVAKINFYGETVGEDERLRLALDNFGRSFNHEDELITATSDIKEPLPNWINTNNKRKELLLAGEEIYPYVGSYKGLINVVKFFGFQQLRIKEYWMNIDQNSENYDKMLQYQLTGMFTDEFDPLKRNPLIGSTVYKKTSMFGLFYDITVETGDVDEFGIPTTEDAFMFTNEEVLVKLFALKKKLQTEFLPLNAKIVDIVGEGIYFERFGQRTWTDPLHTTTVNLADYVDFTANIKIGYIRDLRKFNTKKFANGLDLPTERFTNDVDPYSNGQAYPAASLGGLVDSIHAFYEEFESFQFPYTGEKAAYKGDEPGVVAGCPIVLQAHIFAFTWNDMYMSWDSVKPPADTWDTIDFSNYYEIEWTIEKQAPLGYFFQFRGNLYDYYKLPHFLPYSGKYKITMRIFDMHNQFAMQIKESLVEVFDRKLELAAFCRFRNFDTYTWDGTTDKWNDLAGSTWDFPIEGMDVSVSPINEKLLAWARYKNQEDMKVLNESTGLYEDLIASEDPSAKHIGTRNIGSWENMDLPWDELYHSTWDMYDYHGDFLGGFRIFSPGYGDTIQIDDYDPFVFVEPSPSVYLTLQEAADQLNASTNPGIAKFTYTVRFQPNASPQYSFIHACAKFPGPFGWCFITYTDANTPGIYGDKYSFRKPTWLETIVVDDLITAIENTTNPPTSIEDDLMFLDVPLLDRVNPPSPGPDELQYWVDRGYKKTELPTSQFPYGQRRGSLPSWYGTGSFTSNDVRIFSSPFQVPLAVPVFIIHNHSEIPGKDDTRWVVTNELTGEKVSETKGKPFLIINFIESSIYTVECFVTDSNGNESYTKRTGFVDVRDRTTLGKPKNAQLA